MMFQAFLRTSLRFWFRIGIVLTVPWLIAATLWHASESSREVRWHFSQHLQACYASGAIDAACALKANELFKLEISNVWFTAFGVSAIQLALLWVVGVILVTGLRWSARAL